MNMTRDLYGHTLRVRVCGLIFKGESLLLAKHSIDGNTLWAPPGGGLEFGESIADALKRECKEETNIDVTDTKFLFFTEHIDPPLHAIELFYHILAYEGHPTLGRDPETPKTPVLTDLRFFSPDELRLISNKNLHKCLTICTNPIELLDIRGELK